MVMVAAGAQTVKEDIEASQKRVAELKKLTAKAPKACGIAEFDNYAKKVNEVAQLVINNNDAISEYYYRQLGLNKEGKEDASVQKPAMEEWLALGVAIGDEAVKMKNVKESADAAAKKLQALSDEAKSASNPMAKAKAAKQAKTGTDIIAYSADAMNILVEESAAQTKIIAQLIDAVKNGKAL